MIFMYIAIIFYINNSSRLILNVSKFFMFDKIHYDYIHVNGLFTLASYLGIAKTSHGSGYTIGGSFVILHFM